MQTDPSSPASTVPDSIWIELERLGVIEQVVSEITLEPNKRKRAARVRELERVLKGLKLVPREYSIRRVGIGCNYLGQQGLMIEFLPAEQVIATVPSNSNYAEERSKS